MKVCKTWKQIIENNFFLSKIPYDKETVNLVIDIPRNLFIDVNLTVTGALLIRAKNIYSKPTICLSGQKVTLVAKKISHLGPINAQRFDKYCNESYVSGPMPGGIGSTLQHYSARPDFWSSLVAHFTQIDWHFEHKQPSSS